MELRGELLVHAKEIANLASAHSDVACRHIHIGTNDLIELHHESLTETHDLGIALAARSKVRAAFATAHGQCGERILEGLLEAEELQYAQID